MVAAVLSAGNEVRLGGDYTSQGYYVYDESDTLEGIHDVETEGRGSWELTLGFDGSSFTVGAVNDIRLSTRTLRDQLSLEFRHRFNPTLDFSVSNDAEVRWYHSLFPGIADTSYGKDYLNNVSRLDFDFRPWEWLSLSASDGIELLRYAQPDSFSYDYAVNRLSLDGFAELGLMATFDADYSWSRRWSATGTEYDYNEHGLRVGADRYFDSGLHLAIANDVARRSYASRSRSFWEEDAVLSVGLQTGLVGLELEEVGRWTWYDSTSEVYANLFENSLLLTADFTPRPELTIRFGPGYDFGNTIGAAGDDDYRELSLLVGFDLFRLNRFWISAENRIGRRRYPNADSAFQSNYGFTELMLFASWTILSGAFGEMNLEGMVNIAPEWHTEETDNLTMGIYSLELEYGF